MSECCTVFVGDGVWRIGMVRDGAAHIEVLSPAEEGTLASRVEAVRAKLAEVGGTDGPVVLALPSSWCLCARVSTEGLERGKRFRAMEFRLEEHLPLSAEDFVADFLELEDGEALGVGGERDRLRAVVDALESGGVAVRHICPTALLAAGHAADQHPEIDGVLMGEVQDDASAASGAGHDLVELVRGEPTRWWWYPEGGDALRDELAAWAASRDGPARLAVLGRGDEGSGGGIVEGVEPIDVTGVSREEAAAHHAAAVLADAASPRIDLRRGALAPPDPYQTYRRPIGALAVAVVLLLVAVCAVTQWRGRQYGQLRSGYERQQAEVFRQTLPEQEVPRSIKNRLDSERRKLAGLGGRASDRVDPEALRQLSALTQLRDVLAGLPRDMRYRIVDLSIEPQRVRVRGEARTYAEAERLALALRRSGRYEVDPPETESRRERGVRFLFSAEPRPASASSRASE